MRSRTASAARGGASAPAPARGVPLTRQARAVKALLVAACSTMIALVSHVLAGGAVPAPAGILVPLAVSVFVCLPLSGRTLSLPRLVLSVLASQVVFHWMFVLGTPGSGAVRIDAAPLGHAGHGAPTITLLGGEAAHSVHADGWMWLGHAVAALATIALIRRGEVALVGLRRLALLAVRALFRARPHADVEPVAVPRHVGSGRDEDAPVGRLLTAAVSRRGPPPGVLLAH